MKFFHSLMIVTTFFTLPLYAEAKDGDVHEKVIGVNNVYIPSGFDSTTESYVVVHGWFPHSCYKLKGATVNHVGEMLHEVTVLANVTEGLCLAVIIPFNREVQLGRLAVGDHTVRFQNGDGTYMEKHLVIEQ